MEPGIRPEAQTPWLLKPRTRFWNKHPRETPVSVVIFADRRHRIGRTERMLAAHDDISVWRDRKVKRTKLGGLSPSMMAASGDRHVSLGTYSKQDPLALSLSMAAIGDFAERHR